MHAILYRTRVNGKCKAERDKDINTHDKVKMKQIKC